MSAIYSVIEFRIRALGRLTLAAILAAQPLVPHYAFANPQQGIVTHGSASITGEGSDSVTISQSSDRAFIEWESFSVGAGQRVDFHQPSSQSVTANKVIGTDPSEIFGQISATGKLIILNGNGVVFGADSVIDAAAFIATTHDMAAEDVMSGTDALDLSGGTATIINNGNIAIRDGGFAALLAPQIVNNGVITARLGTVSLAASQSVSVDFYGDGLLSFSADSALQSVPNDGPLIDEQGQITADGGLVTMTTKQASNIITDSVNIGGIVRARSAITQNGRIILSGEGTTLIEDDGVLDASSSDGIDGGTISITAQSLSQGGRLDVSAEAGNGGAVTISTTVQLRNAGRIDAASSSASGGDVRISANSIIENQSNVISVSGGTQGGTITASAETGFVTSGRYDASSNDGTGGRIDLTATDLRLLGARLDASGGAGGGLIRVGGAFQGGKTPDISQAYYDSFVGRWPTLPKLGNAGRSFLNDSTSLIVSSENGDGGTVVIWSDDQTTFLGSISAEGDNGGSVEISSAATLRYASLSNVAVGDGYLLLDPKNITIGSSTELQSWSYQGVIGQWYSQDIDPSNLEAGDTFGSALSLTSDGLKLAIGAPVDDGASNGASATGAVYLYEFDDDDFNGAALSGIIGDGYTGTGNVNIDLDSTDRFGASVALDKYGERLVVGAPQDDGSSDDVANSGAVHLFTFTDQSFSGGVHAGTIGSDYTALDVTNIGTVDKFGRSVSLNGDANMLVVGAQNDDGNGDAVADSGAVYLISFTNNSFAGGQVRGIIGQNYSSDNSLDLNNLGSDDRFGFSVSLSNNGMRLAVGAKNDDGASDTATDTGAVYLFGFENEMYKNASLLATIGSGYSNSEQFAVDLDDSDAFGSAVALNDAGTTLAVGAQNDDGDSNAATDTGAVYLFSFADTDYGTMEHESTIGYLYNKANQLQITDLQDSDKFGSALALNADDRLVVGAAFSDGHNGDAADSGMVKMISFSDNVFSDPELVASISKDAFINDLPNNNLTTSGEAYGAAVSLDGDGDRLAVTAIYDGGNPDSSNNYGAVHLYSFTDTNFSGAVLEGTIGQGYTGGKNINYNADSGDYFGHSLSLNSDGDRLAVGETGYTGGGAVRLFSFTDTSFTGGALTATIAEGVTGDDDVNIALDAGDSFGTSVALSGDGTKLAVGAIYGDGRNNNFSQTGEVRLFSFDDADFTNGQLIATIGEGMNSGQDVSLDLDSGDKFGRSVSLDFDGNRLAVGASEDTGPDSKNDAGAVYLFSFDDLAFTNGALTATIGDGYTNDKNVNVSALSALDSFGVSVSLNAVGDRLAVGAWKDDGNGDGLTDSGAVYLFSFADDAFSTGTLRHTIGSGYSSGDNVALASLDASDYFGISVDFNDAGDRLAVGAHLDDGRFDLTTNVGAVYLFSAAHSSGGYPSDGQNFANLESSDVTVNAYEVADILGRGTNLTLQASNDITIANQIEVGGYVQSAGGLTLRAGRSVDISQNILTNNGDVTIIANDSAANGVIAAQRDSGAGGITIAANRRINANSGDVSLTINDASDRTNNTSGDISLAANAAVIGGQVTMVNNGPTTGSDILVASGAQISAADTGDAITLVADAFRNSNGASALNASSGRYQIWATDSAGHDVTVITPDFIQYGATYGTTTIQGGSTEDGVFYSDTATVSPNFRYAATKTYDGSTSATVIDANIGVTGANSNEDVVLTAASANFDTAAAGSGKQVTLSGLSVASALRGAITIYGYGVSTTSASNSNGVIQRKALSLTGHSAQDKSYDATTGATANYGSLSGVVGDDDVSLDTSSATANFADPNVGTSKSVTLASLGISGTDAVNYAITDQTTTADISAATLTLSSATADDKTYDGGVSATISAYGSLTGVFGSDAVSLDPSSVTASFDTKNVGTNKTVTLNGLAITGARSGNYTLASSATTTANVTPRALSIAAPSAAGKTYDGTDTATITAGTLSGFVGTETVTATATGQFADANVGGSKSVTVTYSLADGTNGGLAGNYALANDTASADISPATLTVNGQSASDKTYDGTDTASVSFTSLSGFVGTETVTATATGQFADANVGTGKSVSVSYSLADGTNGGLASNYALASTTDSAAITAKALSISSPTTTTKTYDADNAITVTAGTLSGFVGSETVTVSASGTASDSNAGTGKSVSVTYTLADGTNGGLASNYSLADGTGSVDITPKALSYGSVSAADKTYDGTDIASITASGLSGFVGTETVTATATGQFADTNAGTGKSVTVTYSLADGTNGGLAGNYALANDTASADISPATLTVNGQSASDKTYDGTDTASVSFTSLSGFVGTETVTATATGQFADANVGTGKSVSVSYSLADGTNGGLASNYALASTTDSAAITAKALSISSPTTTTKTYDADNAITVTAGTLSGFVGSETVTVSASGTTNDSDAGTGKYVTVTYTLADGTNGGLASNYSLANGAGSVDITPKALSYSSVSVADKTYDGTDSASVTASGLSGFVGSETVTALSQGSFADAHVGTSKTATISFALADGTNNGKASNYSLASVTRTAAITAKALSISGSSVSDKIYDATTAATITAGTLSGLNGSETLTVTATGSFADRTVGSAKTVNASYNLADGSNGGLASNYSLADESLSADITARSLTINQMQIASKTYDGSTSATITSTGTLVTIQGSDDVSLDDSSASALFQSANAGTVGVTISGLSLSGADAANYTLSVPSVLGVISRKALQITGSLAANKDYDGTNDAIVTAGTLSGFIGTETVSADAIGRFTSPLAGFDKDVVVSYLLKNGTNGGLAANYSLADEMLLADIEGRTKDKADTTAPMVEKQVKIVETDVAIEREEKLEMIEEVEQKVLEETNETDAFVEAVGDWTILSCEATGVQQGMCSAK